MSLYNTCQVFEQVIRWRKIVYDYLEYGVFWALPISLVDLKWLKLAILYCFLFVMLLSWSFSQFGYWICSKCSLHSFIFFTLGCQYCDSTIYDFFGYAQTCFCHTYSVMLLNLLFCRSWLVVEPKSIIFVFFVLMH